MTKTAKEIYDLKHYGHCTLCAKGAVVHALKEKGDSVLMLCITDWAYEMRRRLEDRSAGLPQLAWPTLGG